MTVEHKDLANAIRFLAMDAVQEANSGHPGMPMGMADVATVLFTRFLKYDASDPDWSDRDRFILSAGHGSMLLYALLYLTGYPDIDLDEIKRFRQLGSKTAGHPEYGHAAGIETTTGPLGQGISTAVGMALAERLLASRFGEEIVNHYTYVIAGDGDLMEGVSHEAASFAGHLGLSRLIVLYDDNGISIDGSTGLAWSDNVPSRFASYGWDASVVDGHDPDAIISAIELARAQNRPSLISCKTTIAYGAPNKSGTAGAHGAPLGDDEIAGTREILGWRHKAFEVPDDIMSVWRQAGIRGAKDRQTWEARKETLDAKIRDEFDRVMSGTLPKGWEEAIQKIKGEFVAEEPSQATRVSSGAVLEKLIDAVPELLGGSADLTGSVNTRVSTMSAISRDDFSGRYIHYGIREHGMAAAMNGMAQHGGIIPYAGTFLVFADYLRPALRLSALMQQRVIQILTHDSIGLGEDGPTHQPVETLASLRAIPNLNVFRPADAVEVVECWELAISMENTPSAITLTRQGVPTLRREENSQNQCAKGGYIISKGKGKAVATLVATGSEVSLAVKAQEILAIDGIVSNVVSLPCWELFDEQPEEYRRKVLGEDTTKVAIEAAVSMGWEKYIGSDGIFIGMSSFGASAPAGDLFKHFRITAEELVTAVKKRL
ncbi:MAG: transketolase [Pseudomonadota bacterium]|nr:transketolase [Pseudomonadota bacterium]